MNFLAFALSLLPSSPPNTPEPAVEIPQGQAWCSSKLCDTYRTYDVLPGHPTSKVLGPMPPLAFCVHCGEQMDIDLPEGEVA